MKFNKGDIVIGTSYYNDRYRKGSLNMFKELYGSKDAIPHAHRTICRYNNVVANHVHTAIFIRNAPGQRYYKHGIEPGQHLRFAPNELRLYIDSEEVQKTFGDIINDI